MAQAVFPASARAPAVTFVDSGDWRAGIAAAALLAAPVGAPILLSDGTTCRRAPDSALKALAPTGSKAAGGAQVIRVGDVATAGAEDDGRARARPVRAARARSTRSLAASRGKASDG